MDPFQLKARPIPEHYRNWEQLYPKAYDKRTTDPYTKARIILMNGTEFEGVKFSHQFSRMCDNNDLRRELAISRRLTQQRQKTLTMLKPMDESVLEHTISYEQLAVDLTAHMAQCESDPIVKSALDFALLEDFDHLYRYADLLDMEAGEHAERLVGGYTELTPGRPTIAHHRFPTEAVNTPIGKDAALLTKLHVNIITAAEQQTMNYYMNTGTFYCSDLGRKLYQEIAMVEEQHVSEYGSLKDPTCTPLENLLMHDYTTAYLYYSMMADETDPSIRGIWEMGFDQAVSQLHASAALLQKYEGRDWQQVLPCADFPQLLKLGSNIDYVRAILGGTVYNTKQCENYVDVRNLPESATFFCYQNTVNPDPCIVPSHIVIDEHIRRCGSDYRFEVAETPVPELRNRKIDNVQVGRE